MLRFVGFALLMAVLVPAILGYAASFTVDPIVNQEFTIPVEDVTTTTDGGPSLVEKSTGPSTDSNFVTVLDTNPVQEPQGCTDAELAAGYRKCLDGTFDKTDSTDEKPTVVPTPTPEPKPTPRGESEKGSTYVEPVYQLH